MGTLIDEGVIQLGDVWKFYYVYGRGPGRIVIEKEVRVCINLYDPHTALPFADCYRSLTVMG
jgi:hypothetical protein